jgi:hypothetical protein
MHWVLKECFQMCMKWFLLKGIGYFFIVDESSFCGSQAHSQAVNLVCWFLSTKSAKMFFYL